MKSYKKPVLNVERFTPNEFVAACGDSGVTYKFVCNATSGSWVTDGGWVYLENGKQDGLQTIGDPNADELLGPYTPCSETHIAESTDSFDKGYLQSYSLFRVKDVIVWRGPNNDNTHCTTNLDMDKWETAKS